MTTADANCTDLGACVSNSLQSAWRGDVDALRQTASKIDALPKPDLGNKAQSRKLNTQALEALKAGDPTQAVQLLQAAQKENPRDVEVASNLGFALVKAQRPQEAAKVLGEALLLDPRRTSTWAPLGEALALSGRQADGAAALWAAWQWSGNREKTETAFSERATREQAERPALAQVYQGAHAWVTQGQRPALRNAR
jgi:Flp pilus assembly protein TadD